MSLKTTSIKKQNIDSRDFQHMHVMESDKLDLRVAVKSEEEITNVPASIQPDLVRIKQQRKFQFKAFSFDFSMTWSGKTRNEAEQSQINNEAVFEIECELVKPAEYLAVHDDIYIATSILLKMHDLMPDGAILSPFE